MPRFMISLDDHPSKDEELQALFKFAHSLPADSYLRRLFTERFLTWVETKLREDWLPDVMMAMDGLSDSKAELYTKMRDALEQAELTAKTRQDRIEKLEGKLETAQEAASKWEQLYRETHQQMLTERHEWSASFSRALNAKYGLKRALQRMREIGAERERKWQFTLEQVQRTPRN